MKKAFILFLVFGLLCSSCGIADTLLLFEKAADTYAYAEELMGTGEYEEAAQYFDSISAYRDASKQGMYCKACALCEEGSFEMGLNAFELLGDFKDSPFRLSYYTARSLEANAVGTTEFEQLETAKAWYEKNPLYLDSLERIAALESRMEEARLTLYNAAKADGESGKYSAALESFGRLGDYQESVRYVSYYSLVISEQALDQDADQETILALAEAYGKLGQFMDAPQRMAGLKARELSKEDKNYNAAVKLMDEGKFIEAYQTFKALEGYKDSAEKAKALRNAHPVLQYQDAKAGDSITFGAYEQDGNTKNGKEPIEWLVLAKENGRLLVLSKYGLDCKPFNDADGQITWENSTLRKWLNNDFLNSAFAKDEISMISIANVPDDPNPHTKNAVSGNPTLEKVFILSVTEANRYLSTENLVKCKATVSTKAQGIFVDNAGYSSWWLRTSGVSQAYATYSSYDGKVNVSGKLVNSKSCVVRPALWIDLDGKVMEEEEAAWTAPKPSATATPTPEPKTPTVDKELLARAAVGDYIVFGAYEQDNNTRNGKEPIEWLVLTKENNRMLVISRYVLMCDYYHDTDERVTWETCALRNRLNNDFLNAAFNKEEQAFIPTVTVPAHKNPSYGTNPGNDTQDKIFLLSITEAKKYFSSYKARQCNPTAYAVLTYCWSSDVDDSCSWWLRTPGHTQYFTGMVFSDYGEIEYGHLAYFSGYGVRPALWIDLDASPTEELSNIEHATTKPNSANTSSKTTPKPTANQSSCTECGGDGKITVNCNKCDGAGKLENYCFTCLSSGFHKCTNCSGKGTAKCTTCGGDAKITCSYCHGNKAFCDPCGWKGFEWCSACNRTGISTCTKCHGIGKVACSSCNGRGRNFVTCSGCNGGGKVTKKCTKCQ